MISNDILLQVRKPARYIGGEWNVSKKRFEDCDLRFALCFPEIYEVGMSNLGVRILYGLLNRMEDTLCERFFSPGADLEAHLRKEAREIFSLESRRSLREFDILGFSLGYELSYTNALNLLDLGGLPLTSAGRDHSYPLVIAGGPSAMNPEPMHEFFDLFVIGEAEEALPEIVESFRKNKEPFKSGRLSKEEILKELCRIEGVYVPSLYKEEHDTGRDTPLEPRFAGVPERIRKRSVKDLSKSYYPCDWLVPY
ncbi:B12-binding domain-containing radical SAM protein, partial [Candidatus Omnitrophota bacterium]